MTDLFIDNKYTLWYGNVIANAKARSKPVCYTEKHHIIPKSLGGDNSPENIVILTAREHFICHWLLTKMVIGNDRSKMAFAFYNMINVNNDYQERYKSSRLFEIKRSVKIFHTDESKRKMSESSPRKGKTYEEIYGEEQAKTERQKRSELMKTLASTEEWKQRSSENGKKNLGRKHSEETNKKKARPGKLNGMYGKTHTNEVKAYLATLPVKYLKGKTYEDIHGPEKARDLKEQRSRSTTAFRATKEGLFKGAKNPNAKTFIVTDPQNNEYVITGNLREWCKENDISFAALYMIFYNKRETTKGSVKGWKIIQAEQVS